MNVFDVKTGRSSNTCAALVANADKWDTSRLHMFYKLEWLKLGAAICCICMSIVITHGFIVDRVCYEMIVETMRYAIPFRFAESYRFGD